MGASTSPQALREDQIRGERWMTIQLVGEIVGVSFERGISQYPNVNDEFDLVTEKDLAVIDGTSEAGQVIIGRLASVEGIPVRIDLDKLLTRHSAVLGSTGSGKSTTVASLLRSIVLGDAQTAEPLPSARVLLLDLHGEMDVLWRRSRRCFGLIPDWARKRFTYRSGLLNRLSS